MVVSLKYSLLAHFSLFLKREFSSQAGGFSGFGVFSWWPADQQRSNAVQTSTTGQISEKSPTPVEGYLKKMSL